jgi:hypothetical protein
VTPYALRFTTVDLRCAIDLQIAGATVDADPTQVSGPSETSEGLALREVWLFDDVTGGYYVKSTGDRSLTAMPGPDFKADNIVFLRRPDDPRYMLPRLKCQWAMGRGFSQNIQDVISVDEAEGGLLRVLGRDGRSGTTGGEWELVLDPTNGIVREARRSVAGSPMAYKIVTSGLLDAGDWMVADSGRVTISMPGNDVFTEYDFEAVELVVNEELLGQARAIFDQDWPDGTIITDDRGPEGVTTTVGSAPTLPERPPSGPPKSDWTSSRMLIICVNLVIVAAILALLGVRAMRRGTPSKGQETR